MPMKWLNLYIYFTIIYLIIMTLIHFMKKIKFKKNYNKNNNNKLTKKKMYWMMKW